MKFQISDSRSSAHPSDHNEVSSCDLMSQCRLRIPIVVIERNAEIDELACSLLSRDRHQSASAVGNAGDKAEVVKKSRKRKSDCSLVVSQTEAEQKSANAEKKDNHIDEAIESSISSALAESIQRAVTTEKKRKKRVNRSSETSESPKASSEADAALKAGNSETVRKKSKPNGISGTSDTASSMTPSAVAEQISGNTEKRKKLNCSNETGESPITSSEGCSRPTADKVVKKQKKLSCSFEITYSAFTSSAADVEPKAGRKNKNRKKPDRSSVTAESSMASFEADAGPKAGKNKAKSDRSSSTARSPIASSESEADCELKEEESVETKPKKPDCGSETTESSMTPLAVAKQQSGKAKKSICRYEITESPMAPSGADSAPKAAKAECQKNSQNHPNAALASGLCPAVLLLRNSELDRMAKELACRRPLEEETRGIFDQATDMVNDQPEAEISTEECNRQPDQQQLEKKNAGEIHLCLALSANSQPLNDLVRDKGTTDGQINEPEEQMSNSLNDENEQNSHAPDNNFYLLLDEQAVQDEVFLETDNLTDVMPDYRRAESASINAKEGKGLFAENPPTQTDSEVGPHQSRLQPVGEPLNQKIDYQPKENPFRMKIPKKSRENTAMQKLTKLPSEQSSGSKTDDVRKLPPCEDSQLASNEINMQAVLNSKDRPNHDMNRGRISEAGSSLPRYNFGQGTEVSHEKINQRAIKEIRCILAELLSSGELTNKNRSFNSQAWMQRIEDKLCLLEKFGFKSSNSNEIMQIAFGQFATDLFCRIESRLIDVNALDLQCFSEKCLALANMPPDLVNRIVEIAFIKHACSRLTLPYELDQIVSAFWHLCSLLGKNSNILCSLNQIKRMNPSSTIEYQPVEGIVGAITCVLRENRQYFYLFVSHLKMESLENQLQFSLSEIQRTVSAEEFSRSLSVALCRHIRWLMNPIRTLKVLQTTENLTLRIKRICRAFNIEYPKAEMAIFEDLVTAQKYVLDSPSIFASFRPFISCTWTLTMIKKYLEEGIEMADLEKCISRLSKISIESGTDVSSVLQSLSEFPPSVVSRAVEVFFNEFLREKSVAFDDHGKLKIQLLPVIQKMRNICSELRIAFPHGSLAPIFERIALRIIFQKFEHATKEKMLEVKKPSDVLRLLGIGSERITLERFDVKDFPEAKDFPQAAESILSAFCSELSFSNLKKGLDKSIIDGGPAKLNNLIDCAVQQELISLTEIKSLLTILAKLCAKRYMGFLLHHRSQLEFVLNFDFVFERFKLVCQQVGAEFPLKLFAEMRDIVSIRKLAMKADLPDYLVASLDSKFELELALQHYSRFVKAKKAGKVSVILETMMQPISSLQDIAASVLMTRCQNKSIKEAASKYRQKDAHRLNSSTSKNSSAGQSEAAIRSVLTDTDNQSLNSSSEDPSFRESRSFVGLILDDPFLNVDAPRCVVKSIDELPTSGNLVQNCELWGMAFATHGVGEGKFYFETLLLRQNEQSFYRSTFRAGWSLVSRSNFHIASNSLPGSDVHSFAYSPKGYLISSGSLRPVANLECAVGDRVVLTLETRKSSCDSVCAIFNVFVAPSPSCWPSVRRSESFTITYHLQDNADKVWVPHIAVLNSDVQVYLDRISSPSVQLSGFLPLDFNTAMPVAPIRPPQQPAVTFNVGLPFSGKTRFTEAQKFDQRDTALTIVSLDALIEKFIAPELGESIDCTETRSRLFEYLKIAGNDLINTCLTHATKMRANVIVDLCNALYSTRRNRVEFCGPGYETKAIIFCPGAKMTKRLIKNGLAARNQARLSNAYQYLQANIEMPGLHTAEFDNVSLFGDGVTEERFLARVAEMRSETDALGIQSGDCDEMLLEVYCRFGLDVHDFDAELELVDVAMLPQPPPPPMASDDAGSDQADAIRTRPSVQPRQRAAAPLDRLSVLDDDEQFVGELGALPLVAAYGQSDSAVAAAATTQPDFYLLPAAEEFSPVLSSPE